MPVQETLLVISGIDFPPWSAYGLTQSLTPIQQGVQAVRTVNGTLINLAGDQFTLKYSSEITAENKQRPPALDGLRLGSTVTVDCIVELAYEDTTDNDAAKTVVSGSERSENGYIFYRPQITFMVLDFPTIFDEWGAAIGWRLLLEEV